MLLYFRFVVNPDITPIACVDIEDVAGKRLPIGKEEIIVLIVFLLVIFSWLAPSFFD